MQIKFKKLTPTAKIPCYAHPTDSGMDLFSDEDIIIPARDFRSVHTGIACALPQNTEGQVRSKSGLSVNFGLQVLNSPGTIDTNYRGEICVILHNVSGTDYAVQKGQKIAQLVVCPFYTCDTLEVDDLDDTDRGTGGFGSTGLM